MIKRILTRLLIVTIFVAGVGIARNVIVQTAICGYANSKLHLPLAMRSARLEPFQGTLYLHEIQLPDMPLHESNTPGDADKISAMVDSISVTMDTGKLLRRYYHFEQIDFHGIHAKLELRDDFDKSRIFVPREIWNRFQTQFPQWIAQDDSLQQDSLAQSLVPLLTGQFDQNAREQLQRQFESPKFSRDVAQRWNKELQPFFQRIRDTAARIERIQGAIRNPKQFSQNGSPQALAASIQELLRDAESLEMDLRNIISQKDSLKTVAQKDALALKQVLKNDYDKIRELRPPKIDPQQIAEMLLGNEIQHRLESILAWTHSLEMLLEQEISTENVELFPGKRAGKNFVFKSRENQTELLAKRIDFDGDLLIENQPVYFLGRIHDASYPSETITLRLCLDFAPMNTATAQERDAILNDPVFDESVDMTPQHPGSSRIYITAVLDTTNPQEISQRYYIACPGFRIPERTLGQSNEFSLTLSPGTSQFYAAVQLIGENINGRVRLTQSPIGLTASSHSEKRPDIQNLLSQLTLGVNAVDMELSFSGTKKQHEFRIKNNFGPQIANNFEGVIAQNWNLMRQNMANELNAQTNQTLRNLGGMFNEELDATLNKLLVAQSQIVGGNTNTTAGQVIQSLLGSSPQTSSPIPPYTSQFIERQFLEQMTPQQNRDAQPLKNIEQELKREIHDGINRLFK